MSPVAGTTRDAVDEAVVHNGIEYVFVDTAGIRRKGKTKLMAEKLSVVMARRHLRLARVALLVIDATEGVLGLDATIAGYAHEEGRALVLVVNKWDLSKVGKRKFLEDLRDELKFLDYADVAFISAKNREGMRTLFGMIRTAYRIGVEAGFDRRIEPVRGHAGLGISHEDLLPDADVGASADVFGVHG